MPDLQKDPIGRRFIPTPANSKPSDLFSNISAKTSQTKSARFRSNTDPLEYLIFISGLSAREGTAPERAVYAYVWGPDGDQQDVNHEVDDLPHLYDPQTAERAQLRAAIKALNIVEGWCEEFVAPRSVVVAFSGNYFLNQVARSTCHMEVQKGRNNLELKCYLELQIISLKERGVTVRFWQIDNENRAEDLANTMLYGKEHLLVRASRTAMTLI